MLHLFQVNSAYIYKLAVRQQRREHAATLTGQEGTSFMVFALRRRVFIGPASQHCPTRLFQHRLDHHHGLQLLAPPLAISNVKGIQNETFNMENIKWSMGKIIKSILLAARSQSSRHISVSTVLGLKLLLSSTSTQYSLR